MRFFFTGIAIGILLSGCAQNKGPQKPNPFHRKSPVAISNVTNKSTNTYVKITYGQPYKKGRRVFGGIVPYGEVWRTGANEATELTTTKPLKFNGKYLAAGTYALFTIPRPRKWTIILNDSLGQWGAFDYDKLYDHLRTSVQPERTKHIVEAFTIRFADIHADTSSILLRWDSTKVAIPIKFIPSDTSAAPAIDYAPS